MAGEELGTAFLFGSVGMFWNWTIARGALGPVRVPNATEPHTPTRAKGQISRPMRLTTVKRGKALHAACQACIRGHVVTHF